MKKILFMLILLSADTDACTGIKLITKENKL